MTLHFAHERCLVRLTPTVAPFVPAEFAYAFPATLTALRTSPKTTAQEAKFILATDGAEFQAENLRDSGTVACTYPDLHDHFGFSSRSPASPRSSRSAKTHSTSRPTAA